MRKSRAGRYTNACLPDWKLRREVRLLLLSSYDGRKAEAGMAAVNFALGRSEKGGAVACNGAGACFQLFLSMDSTKL